MPEPCRCPQRPSAIRGTFDYTDVRILVTAVTEQILGIAWP